MSDEWKPPAWGGITREEEKICKIHIDQPLTPAAIERLEWDLSEMRFLLKVQQKKIDYLMGLSNKRKPSDKISRILNEFELNLQIAKKELSFTALCKLSKSGDLKPRGKRQVIISHLKKDERFTLRHDKEKHLYISLDK